jgi:TatD DNase family protein
LSDPVFKGNYHGKQVHENDLDDIIQRARDVGCQKFMVTGSDLGESKHAIDIARKYRILEPRPSVSTAQELTFS